MDNLDHEFARLDCVDDVLTEGFLLDGVGECLGYFIVDVGVDERTSDVLKGFGNVDFGDFALAFEDFETAFEPVAEFFKHRALWFGLRFI